jgi:hypothetical protein
MFFSCHAVLVGNLMGLVRQEREAEAVLLIKLLPCRRGSALILTTAAFKALRSPLAYLTLTDCTVRPHVRAL